VHCAVTLPKPEKPVTVDVMLELGLKIPILYRITATMTMIKIAQP
jgi:hypothetical protein